MLLEGQLSIFEIETKDKDISKEGEILAIAVGEVR